VFNSLFGFKFSGLSCSDIGFSQGTKASRMLEGTEVLWLMHSMVSPWLIMLKISLTIVSLMLVLLLTSLHTSSTEIFKVSAIASSELPSLASLHTKLARSS